MNFFYLMDKSESMYGFWWLVLYVSSFFRKNGSVDGIKGLTLINRYIERIFVIFKRFKDLINQLYNSVIGCMTNLKSKFLRIKTFLFNEIAV